MQKQKKKQWCLWIGIFIGILIVVSPLFLLISKDVPSGNVAIIKIRGMITTETNGDFFGEDTASSEDIVSFINDAVEDKNIKAIVMDINSPGGSAVASDEIAQALKNTNKTKIALIHEIGTSGAYWIASAADIIVANRMSITGSIGVIASYVEFSKLMNTYGVGYERLVAGKYKDIGTPFKKLTDEERTIFQSKLDKLHSFFIEEVAKNRKLSKDQVKPLATGDFFLGYDALDKGLVDMLGNTKTVDSYLQQLLNTTDVRYTHYEPERSFFDVLASITSKQSFFMGKGMGSVFVSAGEPQLPFSFT